MDGRLLALLSRLGARIAGEPPVGSIEEQAPMVADLDDREGLCVCADWLLDRGHPRGELIALALAFEQQQSPELGQQILRAVRDNRRALMGYAIGAVCADGKRSLDRRLQLRWRRGYVVGAAIHAPCPDLGNAAIALRMLNDHAAFCYLTRIELSDLDSRAGSRASELLPLIARGHHLDVGQRPVSQLVLSGRLDDGEISLSRLAALCDQLTMLDLSACELRPPQIRVLERHAERFAQLGLLRLPSYARHFTLRRLSERVRGLRFGDRPVPRGGERPTARGRESRAAQRRPVNLGDLTSFRARAAEAAPPGQLSLLADTFHHRAQGRPGGNREDPQR